MAICRNIQNNVYYRYLGENKYRNLTTGVEGIIDEKKAVEIFRFNVEATYLCETYPMVEELISRLKLKSDVVRVSD